MLYLDGLSLRKIRNELEQSLLGTRIHRITRNTDSSLSLFFGRRELVFSCDGAFPVLYEASEKETVLDPSGVLTDTLRKHLPGAELISLEQLGLDRVYRFRFRRLTELGESREYRIYFEWMGGRSNFIFTDDVDLIIDLMKRRYLDEEKGRPLFPGALYEKPALAGKNSPYDVTPEDFAAWRNEAGDRLPALLREKLEGIGKRSSEQIGSYEDLRRFLDAPPDPRIFTRKGTVVLATVLPLAPAPGEEILTFGSYKDMIAAYMARLQLSRAYDVMKKYLRGQVEKKIKKDRKILDILNAEKAERQDYERFREMGDILAANLYRVNKGDANLKAADFYRNEEIAIPLDIRLTPKENLDKFYKQYNRAKRGLEANMKRLEEIRADLDWLDSLLVFIDGGGDIENLRLIYEEALRQGVVRDKENVFNRKNKKASGKSKAVGYGEVIYKNRKFLYGRNNLENDRLTLQTAGRMDLWFHGKDVPGAHVILPETQGLPFTEDDIASGCQVAAWFTAVPPGGRVLVDYTKKKYIRKPKGGKPGFVTYTHEKGVLVEKKALD